MEHLTSKSIDIRTESPVMGLVIVHVCGEVDIVAAPALRNCVDDQLRDVRCLVLDLTGTSFFGAAGLSVLVHAAELAARRAVTWAVVCPSVVLRPLQATNLDGRMPVCSDLDEAVAVVTGEEPALSR